MNSNEIERYIDSFRAEVRDPNIFLFSLMLSNRFKGEVLVLIDEEEETRPDIVVSIGNKIYDIFGEIDSEIDLSDYARLDRLSSIASVNMYENCKWIFINEDNYDQSYFNEIN